MKLTEEQKQTICDVYERAMTVKEKFSGTNLLITFNIDNYEAFEIRAYENNGVLGLNRLAGDRTIVYEKINCFEAIDEIEAYCDTFLNNKEKAKRARIKTLEEELAKLKED